MVEVSECHRCAAVERASSLALLPFSYRQICGSPLYLAFLHVCLGRDRIPLQPPHSGRHSTFGQTNSEAQQHRLPRFVHAGGITPREA
jgi:hypothetical protein